MKCFGLIPLGGDGESEQVWPDLGNEARKEQGREHQVSE